jgi:hypothetical protein
MALKPEFSVMGGLAVASIVFAIHAQATPSQADIAALPAGTPDVDDAERKATIISAGVVAGISLIAGDPTIFVIGSGMTIAMALWTRHNTFKESIGGKYLTSSEAAISGTTTTGPAPVTTEAYVPFQNDFAR